MAQPAPTLLDMARGLRLFNPQPVAPSGGATTWAGLLARVVLAGAVSMAGAMTMIYVLRLLDPMRHWRSDTDKQSKVIMSRLKLPSTLKVNEHERVIMTEVILSADLTFGFTDIGGLDAIIQSLKETVLYPLKHPQLFGNELLRPPKGVLLYGPPGCGKTMLAKAIAKESNATFINLRVSTLTEKWFGESQKLVKAVFTLAQKLQPSIIFIDEIDSFLRERSSMDHETIGMMKAEFMSLWDGLTSSDDRVIVLGATNRASEIDRAILRRMPAVFNVALPSEEQRLSIFKLILANQNLDESVDLTALSRATDGYSGSDIKEFCRNAAMRPLRDYMRSNSTDLDSTTHLVAEGVTLRKLSIDDFFTAEHKAMRQTYEDILRTKAMQGALRNVLGSS